MSRRTADITARRALLYPDARALGPYSRKPTKDERVVFAHFGVVGKTRKIAIYAARRSYPQAKEIYAAIARSLG